MQQPEKAQCSRRISAGRQLPPDIAINIAAQELVLELVLVETSTCLATSKQHTAWPSNMAAFRILA